VLIQNNKDFEAVK